MTKVRIGIVGVGNMGAAHAKMIVSGAIRGLELAALCDVDARRLETFPDVPGFAEPETMIASGQVDAVLVATPHFDHVATGIAALKAGLHVMVEKPIAAHKADAQRLIQAARRRPKQVFAAMFNQRTDDYYRKIRQMIVSGELGEIQRVNWIITTWFRTAAYYRSGSWRATWAGEGGGVLLNQCPHNLDLFQWMFGMPRRLRAFGGFGRYHAIEVEDEITAVLEYPNGASGVLITSTGEAPGTNRLEITADRGRLVYEDDRLVFHRNAIGTREFSRTSRESFAQPAVEEQRIDANGHGGQHGALLQNFADAILSGAPLIAPGAEGIHSLELANAMILSAWTDRPVRLPLSAAAYSRFLLQRIAQSKRGRRAIPGSRGRKPHR